MSIFEAMMEKDKKAYDRYLAVGWNNLTDEEKRRLACGTYSRRVPELN